MKKGDILPSLPTRPSIMKDVFDAHHYHHRHLVFVKAVNAIHDEVGSILPSIPLPSAAGASVD